MNKKVIIVSLLAMNMAKGVDVTGQSDAELVAKSAELAALQASRATLVAGLESPKGVLKGFEKTTGLVVEGTRAIFKGGLQAFQVKSIKAHVGAREWVDGKLPKVQIDLVIFGKSQTLKDIVFDVKNTEDSAKKLVQKLLDTVNAFQF